MALNLSSNVENESLFIPDSLSIEKKTSRPKRRLSQSASRAQSKPIDAPKSSKPPAPDNWPRPEPSTKKDGIGFIEPALKIEYGIIDLDPKAMSRPPNWRWQLALHREQGTRLPRKWSDEWIGKARQLIRALRKCKANADVIDVFLRYSDLYTAFRIATYSSPIDRWLLEARILTGAPASTVAKKASMNEATLHWYETLFYDVRPTLQSTSHIVRRVIRWPDAGRPDQGQIWKAIAYRFGMEALDLAIFGTPPGPKPTNPEEARRFFQQHLSNVLLIDHWAESRSRLPSDGRVALRQLKSGMKQLQAKARERVKDRDGFDVERVLAGVADTMRDFPMLFRSGIGRPLGKLD